jgi:hypothetical protein
MSGRPHRPRRPAWLAAALALAAAPAAAQAPARTASPKPAPAASPKPAPAAATPGPAATPAGPAAAPKLDPAGPAATPKPAPAGPVATPKPAPAGPATPAPAATPATPAPTAAPATPAPPGPGAAGPAAPAALAGEIPPSPPRDPNDAPFMRPPNNQPAPTPLRTSPDLRRGYSSVRRFAFTLAPLFASFRLPFLGDRPSRIHGAGVGGELDVQVIRWIWVRAQATYTVHPVTEVRTADADGDVVETAARGTIRAAGFGVGPVFALDLGRFLPLIEAGIGGLRVVTPAGVQEGQLGQECGDGGACDVGLTCGGDNVCRPGMIGELYFGAAVDVLVRRHWSLGGQFRYYALLTAPGRFPVYLLAGVRLAIRF